MFKLLQTLKGVGFLERTWYLALTLFLLQSGSAFAKTPTEATGNLAYITDTLQASVDSNFTIVLKATTAASRDYVADLSPLKTKTEQELKSFFEGYSDNVALFKVDCQKLILHIHFLPAAEGAHEFSSTAERNEYLMQKLENYRNSLKSN